LSKLPSLCKYAGAMIHPGKRWSKTQQANSCIPLTRKKPVPIETSSILPLCPTRHTSLVVCPAIPPLSAWVNPTLICHNSFCVQVVGITLSRHTSTHSSESHRPDMLSYGYPDGKNSHISSTLGRFRSGPSGLV